jgi:hypothetical protein
MRIISVSPGDRVRLKKKHACGGQDWEVTRTGMDIGLKCLGCGRKIRLARSEFNRSFKEFVSE